MLRRTKSAAPWAALQAVRSTQKRSSVAPVGTVTDWLTEPVSAPSPTPPNHTQKSPVWEVLSGDCEQDASQIGVPKVSLASVQSALGVPPSKPPSATASGPALLVLAVAVKPDAEVSVAVLVMVGQLATLPALTVSEQLALTDAFVIVSAPSDRQVSSIVDEVEDKLREKGAKPIRREGEREGRWVLLDYGVVVVHVQHEEERQFYALERLWRDCPVIELPADVTVAPTAPADSD